MKENKYIPTFESFLDGLSNELNEGKKYAYGCAMLQFDFPDMKMFHEKIEEDDLSGDGIEKDPHVTLLYGLHSEEIKDIDVIDICQSIKIGPMDLHNISLFENKDFDVLKFDVRSNFLRKINEKLSDLPHTTDYPDYHAHATIAYLKPGKGKKYVDMFNSRAYEVYPTRFVYSKPSGELIRAGVSMKNEMR
jgi:hypothetical protein